MCILSNFVNMSDKVYVGHKGSKINPPLIKGAKLAIGAHLTVILWRETGLSSIFMLWMHSK